MQVLRKMDDKVAFAVYRVLPPWQPVTKRPVGHRGGGGKGGIDRYEIPVKPDRIIIEVGGKVEFEEVRDMLTVICGYMPFKARIVSRELLRKEEEEKKILEKQNLNPITWKYAAEKNMCGIRQFLSPYEVKWDGKYR